jgi:hypothetical protein
VRSLNKKCKTDKFGPGSLSLDRLAEEMSKKAKKEFPGIPSEKIEVYWDGEKFSLRLKNRFGRVL